MNKLDGNPIPETYGPLGNLPLLDERVSIHFGKSRMRWAYLSI